jgi:hypothetical protein
MVHKLNMKKNDLRLITFALFCEFENAKQGRRKKTYLGVLLELVAWGDDVWTRVLLPSLFFSLFCVPSVRPLFVLGLSALSLCPLFPPLFWVLSLSFFWVPLLLSSLFSAFVFLL